MDSKTTQSSRSSRERSRSRERQDKEATDDFETYAVTIQIIDTDSMNSKSDLSTIIKDQLPDINFKKIVQTENKGQFIASFEAKQDQVQALSSSSNLFEIGPCQLDSKVGKYLVKGALRITGLPYQASEASIARFFSGYGYIKHSAKFKFSHLDGRPLGQAAVLFDSEVLAQKAYDEKQRQNFGQAKRYVLLHDLDLESYYNFESYDPQSQNFDCQTALTEENVLNCVKLNGLPYEANARTIEKFFGRINLKVKNVYQDVEKGKNTGFALVELENEEQALQACLDLDRQTIGSRWIGVQQAQMCINNKSVD